jgi:hypothetical protein
VGALVKLLSYSQIGQEFFLLHPRFITKVELIMIKSASGTHSYWMRLCLAVFGERRQAVDPDDLHDREKDDAPTPEI